MVPAPKRVGFDATVMLQTQVEVELEGEGEGEEEEERKRKSAWIQRAPIIDRVAIQIFREARPK